MNEYSKYKFILNHNYFNNKKWKYRQKLYLFPKNKAA